jgi:hypothetical protein
MRRKGHEVWAERLSYFRAAERSEGVADGGKGEARGSHVLLVQGLLLLEEGLDVLLDRRRTGGCGAGQVSVIGALVIISNQTYSKRSA